MKSKKSRIDLIAEFDRLPDMALVSQKTIAVILGCSEAKLERDRWAGTGIPFLKLGPRMVRYRKADVVAYAAEYKSVRSTTEAQAFAALSDD